MRTEKTEELDARIAQPGNSPIWLRLAIKDRESSFEWSNDGEAYFKIGKSFDTSKFSDEYCKLGEFTGSFIGLFCVDSMCHKNYADFKCFIQEMLHDRTLVRDHAAWRK